MALQINVNVIQATKEINVINRFLVIMTVVIQVRLNMSLYSIYLLTTIQKAYVNTDNVFATLDLKETHARKYPFV